MEEWKIYKLGEITSKIGSGATPKGGKDSYLGGNIALIRSQNVLDFSFSKSGLAYINEMQAEKLNNVEVYEKDVLLNITGDSVARVCIVPNNVLPARVNQHVAIIRGNEKVDYRYLLYYLQYIKPQLLSLSQGGATRNALTKKMIEELEIKMPSKGTQKEIVSILYTLDTKIALNRRINDNLEQQAQALFKSWFVDFEPFKDGKLVESEMGMIPEGWKYIKLGKLCESVSITHPQKTGKLIFLNTGDIECGMVNKHNYMNINEMPGQAKKSIKENDILYSEIRPCNKHYAFVNFSADEYIVSTKLMVIRTYNNNSLRIYQFLTRKEIIDLLQHEAESRSGTFPQIRFDNISDLDILLATEPIEKQYSHLISGIYNKVFKNELEISKLQQLRDCILPKLMSGELKINDLNC